MRGILTLAAGATAVGASLAITSSAGAAAFQENFNDGLAASRWTTAFQLEATREPSTVQDGSVNYAFNYSSLGIAGPNGQADTIGAFIQVNKTNQVGNEGESYVIFPNSYALPSTGDWRVDADMFVYNDGEAGSTELGMMGAYMNPANPVAPYQWGTAGGPLAWIYSGEGGSTADIAVFKEGNSSSTGYNAVADYNNIPAGTIPGFETGTAGALGPAPASSPRGSWVDVSVVKAGSTISFLLNGVEVNSYENTGFYSDGTIFLGHTDPFNSSNGGNGTVIDNVVVTVPEPAGLALAGLGSLALIRRKRRS